MIFHSIQFHWLFIFSFDSSPTYQLVSKGSKSKAKDKDKNYLKEAPLVDPEPTSDISNFNAPNTNNGNISSDPSKAGGKALHSALSAHGKNWEHIELWSIDQLLSINARSLLNFCHT